VPSPGVKRAINGGLAVLLGVLECLLGFLGQDAIGEGGKVDFSVGGAAARKHGHRGVYLLTGALPCLKNPL
jgi:hypothetical protein